MAALRTIPRSSTCSRREPTRSKNKSGLTPSISRLPELPAIITALAPAPIPMHAEASFPGQTPLFHAIEWGAHPSLPLPAPTPMHERGHFAPARLDPCDQAKRPSRRHRTLMCGRRPGETGLVMVVESHDTIGDSPSVAIVVAANSGGIPPARPVASAQEPVEPV